MRFFTFEPTDRPRWFELRRRFARWLVNIARRIYPQSPEVFAFLQEVMMEEVLYGSAVVKMPDMREVRVGTDKPDVFRGKGLPEILAEEKKTQ